MFVGFWSGCSFFFRFLYHQIQPWFDFHAIWAWITLNISQIDFNRIVGVRFTAVASRSTRNAAAGSSAVTRIHFWYPYCSEMAAVGTSMLPKQKSAKGEIWYWILRHPWPDAKRADCEIVIVDYIASLVLWETCAGFLEFQLVLPNVWFMVGPRALKPQRF